MSTGYQEIYGEIGSQRKQISNQRSELAKPVVQGTAKQRRVVMRRVKRTPEYGRDVRAKREYSSELDVAERELAEHESKVREYEQQGYKVSKKDDQYRFTKKVKKKVTRSGYRNYYSITYRDYKGVKHTVVTRDYNKTNQNISRMGGTFIKSRLLPNYKPTKPTKSTKTVTTTKTESLPFFYHMQPTTNLFNNKDVVAAVSYAAGVTLENYHGQSPPRSSRPGTTATMEEVGTSYITTPKLSKDPEPTQVEVATKRTELTIKRDQVYDPIVIKDIYRSELKSRGYDIVTVKGEDVIIKGTEAGYLKSLNQYAWTKSELKKIDKAYKINPVLGGVAEFGFGITSSFAGTIQSFHSLLGYKPKRQYISMFDAYTNPAAKEIYAERPILYYGSTFGFATEVIAWMEGPSAIKSSVTGTTKFLIQKTPVVFGKIKTFTGVTSPVLKSESLLLESGKLTRVKITPTFLAKTYSKVETIGQTQHWKNILGWSKGDLVFAKSYPLAKNYPKIFRGDGSYAKIEVYKGFGKRILVPRKVALQEQIGQKLTTTFRGVRGQGFTQTTVYQQTYKPTGLFRKNIRKVYVSAEKGSGYQKVMDQLEGSFFIRPSLSSDVGAIRITRKGFIESTDASARLVPTITIPHGSYSSPMRGFGSLGRENMVFRSPVSGISSVTGFIPLSISNIRSLSESIQNQGYGNEFKSMQHSRTRSGLSIKQGFEDDLIQVSLPSSIQSNLPINETIQMQQQKQKKAYKSLTKQMYKPPTPPPTKTPPGRDPPPPPTPRKIYWLDDTSGGVVKKRKVKKKSLKGYKTGYRYREWKVPKLKDLIPVR